MQSAMKDYATKGLNRVKVRDGNVPVPSHMSGHRGHCRLHSLALGAVQRRASILLCKYDASRQHCF